MSLSKLKPVHLQRKACVYVRQSSAAQVLENAESRKRQYALVERAVELGWPRGAVEVIDEDTGKSGASAKGRTGFARLAHGVAHGEVGAIFALEVSRLARSSSDWQRLLSLCAVAQVVVGDEGTLYDPAEPDDKMLLDLKGTMSEAELHWLGLRMVGARRAKARRGELRMPIPVGYVWTEEGLAFDPDEAVQRAVRLVFERFRVEPTAWAVVRWAHENGLAFPRRSLRKDGGGEVEWKPLGVSRLNDMLHNPTYAGAYVYGRRPQAKALVNGEIRQVRASGKAPEEWAVCIRDAHPGYIRWEDFLANQEKLRGNCNRPPVAQGAPREGGALLGGLLLCGRCGHRMRVSYSRAPLWYYFCAGNFDKGEKPCWLAAGKPLDVAIERLFLEAFLPDTLEVSLAVEHEVQAQSAQLARQWQARLEQAHYEARRAERRYKAVEPENRTVARTLERQWEERLQQAAEVERRYEEARHTHRVQLNEEDRARIRALARDLPAVWHAPTTSPADKKAMLRLVIEAIALTPLDVPSRQTRVEVQWKSGAVSQLLVDRPTAHEVLRTPDVTVEAIQRLAAAGLNDQDIAARLNAEGVLTATGKTWSVWAIRWVRQRHGIPRLAPDAPRALPLPDRHPSDGRYSVRGAARRFGVTPTVVRNWMKAGRVPCRREDFGQRRGVYWLTIDEQTARSLEALSQSKPPHTPTPRRRGRSAS